MDAAMLRRVIELETWLHDVLGKVQRAEVNLSQAVREFPACTPGNGSPGGGKGASSAVIRFYDADDVEVDVVPVTGVEAMAFAGADSASVDLERLRAGARDAATVLAGLMVDVFGVRPVMPPVSAPAVSWVRHARNSATLVKMRAEAGVFPSSRRVSEAHRVVGRLHRVCDAWSFVPARPKVDRDKRQLLAVDLTEARCTSHLRIGVRVDRFRGELCEWCYRNGPLLVASWTAPPVELVQLKEDQNGKVYAHQIEPFLRAERDRVKQKRKAGRR
jgi:hypothetical protein